MAEIAARAKADRYSQSSLLSTSEFTLRFFFSVAETFVKLWMRFPVSLIAANVERIGQLLSAKNTPDFGSDGQPSSAKNTPDFGSDGQPSSAKNTPDFGSDGQPSSAKNTPDFSSDGQLLSAKNTPDFGSDGQPSSAKNTPDFSSDGQLLSAKNTPDFGSDGAFSLGLLQEAKEALVCVNAVVVEIIRFVFACLFVR